VNRAQPRDTNVPCEVISAGYTNDKNDIAADMMCKENPRRNMAINLMEFAEWKDET